MKHSCCFLVGIFCGILVFVCCFSVSPGQVPDGPPFHNKLVGTAGGPPGRTNIQTMADFEDGILYTINNKDEDGYFFSERAQYNLALVPDGPPGSTTCLKITQTSGAYKIHDAWQYIQMFWEGPRKGEEGFMKYTRRANMHSVMIRAFDGIAGDQRANLVIGGYAKRRTPAPLAESNPESDNMHNYYQMKVDWGGGVWREIVVRNNPTHQRSEKHHAGYEPFLDNAELWPDHTRLYWNFLAGTPELGPGGEVFMDNFIWCYENPFLAGFPQVSRRHVAPGQTAIYPLIIWNTHPGNTRNFEIRYSGYVANQSSASPNIKWWEGNVAIRNVNGQDVSETGPLEPGTGIVVYVHHTLPPTDKDGNALGEGTRATILVSAFEKSQSIPNPYPYQRANPVKNLSDERYDLHGIGFVIRTIYAADMPAPAAAPAVADLTVTQVGGTWADLGWKSPAKMQDERERSIDPAAMAYAIRYSETPITDSASWNAAVPAESAPPVFGPELQQRYALRGLKFNTTYYAAVRTYNEAYRGSPIRSVMFTTHGQDTDLGKSDPPLPNEAPFVVAGEDQTISIASAAILNGAAEDDGLPDPPGALTILWQLEEGPGTVTFSDPRALITSARFSEPGEYVLQLSADDGEKSAISNLHIEVLPSRRRLLVDFGTKAKKNEYGMQGWETAFKDRLTKYLKRGPGGTGIAIGRNARYNYQGVSGTPRYFGLGERIEVMWYNAGKKSITFTPQISFDDPDRYINGSSGTWYAMSTLSLAPGEQGATFFTFHAPSVGTYSLVNVNNNFNNRKKLIADKITLILPDGNQTPEIDAGEDQILTLPQTAFLTGAVVDDGLPDPPGEVAVSWDLERGPAPVRFSDPEKLSTEVEFDEPGDYILQLTADDGEKIVISNVRVEVLPEDTYLLVDFGASEADNVYGLDGWETAMKDKLSDYVDSGPDGIGIVIGSNANYNYQGVYGTSRDFEPGEMVAAAWYNAGANTVTFTPRISFDDPDRVSQGIAGTWYEMSEVTIAPGDIGGSYFIFDTTNAGVYSLVNLNNNFNNQKLVLADRIAVDLGESSGAAKRPVALNDEVAYDEVHETVRVHPNPFSGEATITFHLQESRFVSLKVFDILGHHVRILLAKLMPPGEHRIVWDATDTAGRAPGDGLYLVRLDIGASTTSEVLMLKR